MMMTMMSGPPENSLLRGGHGHEGNDELKGAAGFVRAMRKIAVVAGGNEKHSKDEKGEAREKIQPVKGKEENSEREKMNDGERYCKENRNTGAVGQRNRPIARESSHPARFLREIKCSVKPSRSGVNANAISV